MRAIKISLLTLAGAVAVTLIFCIFLIVQDRLAQPPPPDLAALIAKASLYDVRIRRDSFGVPHVSGNRDADVAFGLAFAHSEDDFRTIQQVALATRGQLAANEGRDAAVADYLVHLLRVWESVNSSCGSLCGRRELLRRSSSPAGNPWRPASHRKRHRRGVCLQDAFLLWPGHGLIEAYKAAQ